ncbi:MAG: lipoprotein-releasing system transmembrane subunit LolC [Alphaproteobacteria bacterium]|nr:MAG: lipoprotein-releasing system transmembrane subunit LolC [Alphaproteobacteria bacterium]
MVKCMNPFLLTIAWRYLTGRKGGTSFVSFMTLFSFIGTALGIAVLILVMGVMTGFHKQLLDKILSFNAHVTILSSTDRIHQYSNLVEKLNQQPEVTSALPVVEGQGLLIMPRSSYGVLIRGYCQDDFTHLNTLSKKIIQGNALSILNAEDTILIGKQLARQLFLTVGDRVKVMSPQGQKTPFGLAPKQKTFTIGGVFDSGKSDYNKLFLITSLKSAQRFFSLQESVSLIEVNGPDPERLPPLKSKIRNMLKQTGLHQLDWQQRNKLFFAALVVEKNVMFIVLSLIILIAAFNITTGLTMLLRDKTRDIGILRAIGLTKNQIAIIFLYIGLLIGFLGTGLGVGLALLIGHYLEDIRQFLQSITGTTIFDEEIYYLTRLPVEIQPLTVLKIAGISIVFTLLSTFYPVWRVKKLNPVEAIRYE